MNDMKSQLQKTGHSKLNTKDGGTGSVQILEEMSLLSAIFTERLIWGYEQRYIIASICYGIVFCTLSEQAYFYVTVFL